MRAGRAPSSAAPAGPAPSPCRRRRRPPATTTEASSSEPPERDPGVAACPPAPVRTTSSRARLQRHRYAARPSPSVTACVDPHPGPRLADPATPGVNGPVHQSSAQRDTSTVPRSRPLVSIVLGVAPGRPHPGDQDQQRDQRPSPRSSPSNSSPYALSPRPPRDGCAWSWPRSEAMAAILAIRPGARVNRPAEQSARTASLQELYVPCARSRPSDDQRLHRVRRPVHEVVQLLALRRRRSPSARSPRPASGPADAPIPNRTRW